MDYNETLNLPSTEFSMRGNLQQKEPAMLEKWEEDRLYYKLVEKNKDKPKYILHDGPPYANGNIHLGTTLNKVLKDIVVKQKSMSGYNSVYVPGWDTHGLPIELKAMKAMGPKASLADPIELRKNCRDYAMSFVESMKGQFKRLGVWGDFDDPYLTLKPEFEAKQIEVFGAMAKKDFIYKGLKPVYWCPDCHTALAEAEIEYSDDKCYSIYVKFAITDDKGICEKAGVPKDKAYIVIWTTTTWTLPGNLAICLGPDYEYTFVEANGEYYLMAKELAKETMAAADITDYTFHGSFRGSELEFVETAHPFLDRKSIVIVGDHVTLESGTGCVHTAPGHGQEDFEVCDKYDCFDIIVPVDDKGVLNELAGPFAGLKTDDANKAIAKHLEETGNLFALKKIVHQYPHCWRCNSPIIYRATKQWFCSVDGFKDDAIAAVESVKWIPDWGETRIKNMIRDRSDWCISRQRIWGVPIPVLYCKDCGKAIVNDESIKAIADLFRAKSSDAWYTDDPSSFLPADFKCDCGCKEFTKETDIMDVWFDSGCSHAAVLDVRDDLQWPADLYLEGADQYRGWFQSSLLTAVAWRKQSPYKTVCTHGWVVDGEGRKMSKSLGNGIEPEQIIKQYGADILRLWVASSDYHSDVRISQDILKQLSESYRKIRNTARYMLGNLSNGKGFNPDTDMVSISDLTEIDKWALVRLNEVISKVERAYNDFDFHIVLQTILSFCITDLSNFYLDIIKDRLYCEKEESTARRAAQTAMYIILDAVTKMIAPILAFTSEEIWKYMPHKATDDTTSVVFNDMPKAVEIEVTDEFTAKWEKIYAIREDVKKALEIKRTDKVIGSALEANVTLHCDETLYDFVNSICGELKDIFIVSDVKATKDGEGDFVGDYTGLSVTVEKASGDKCERCWCYSEEVGKNASHPTLCARCASVVE